MCVNYLGFIDSTLQKHGRPSHFSWKMHTVSSVNLREKRKHKINVSNPGDRNVAVLRKVSGVIGNRAAAKYLHVPDHCSPSQSAKKYAMHPTAH